MTARTPHFGGWVAFLTLAATRFASKISGRGKQAALGKNEWRQGRRHDHVRAVFPVSASVRHRASPEPRARGQTRAPRILGVRPRRGPRQARAQKAARCAARGPRRRRSRRAALARPKQRATRAGAMTDAAFRAWLDGYGLMTAEIHYHRPDAPSLLQLFVWQHHDLAPDFPVLFDFLAHWRREMGPPFLSCRSRPAWLSRPPLCGWGGGTSEC